MKYFVYPSFGAIDIAGTTEYTTQAGTFLLQKHGDTESDGQNQLDYIEDCFFHNY